MPTWLEWARRRFGAAALAALAAVPCTAAPAADAEAVLRELSEQHRRADYPAMRDSLLALLAQAPGNPLLVYQLAAVDTLRGEPAAALAALDALAEQGLSFAPDRQDAFAGLQAQPGYTAVLSRFRHNAEPAGEATLAFSGGPPDFIPEGLAQADGLMYLSSVRRREILRIDADGRSTRFAGPESGLWSALGLATDAERGLLWVATSAYPEMLDYDPLLQGRSALLGLDLRSGELRHRLDSPADGRLHAFTDVRLLSDGRVVVSDAAAGQLYAWRPGASDWQTLLPEAQLHSPQGFVEWDDGSLIIADYSRGLWRLSADGAQLSPVTHDARLCSYGVDGLYRDGNALLAIQNGVTPARVLRWRYHAADNRIDDERLMLRAHPLLLEPALATVAQGQLFVVADSQWRHFDKHHRLPVDAPLRAPQLLRIALPQSPAREKPPASRLH